MVDQDHVYPGAPLPSHSAPSAAVETITTTIRVASGVLAPGHLGELTQLVPFEMVDAALAATGTIQARTRLLPARVVGYPLLRLLALTACGTRSIIDATFGPTSSGETTYARQLLPSLGPGMIVLLDRNFPYAQLLNAIAATKAHLLVRLKATRKLPVLAQC